MAPMNVAEAVAKLHFPAFIPMQQPWLATRRKIKAVGLDVASVDYGKSKDFKTHQLLYEKISADLKMQPILISFLQQEYTSLHCP
ncbi:MAG: hypothetical protein IPP96_17790 [Chitinophagaceae bacterium]|nr:hypothetical protein [Chitinophagaceae bacterium]